METQPLQKEFGRKRKRRKKTQKTEENLFKKVGEEAFLPQDEFEWGMVNGKISALRWILGDEWDFLDT